MQYYILYPSKFYDAISQILAWSLTFVCFVVTALVIPMIRALGMYGRWTECGEADIKILDKTALVFHLRPLTKLLYGMCVSDVVSYAS